MPEPPEVDWAALLDERLASARAQHAALTAAIEDMRLSRSLTFADDEHDPEGSTVSLDQARDAALLARVAATLGELEAARRRLGSGDHGRCDQCGRPIPVDRLLARPEARTCVGCAAGAR